MMTHHESTPVFPEAWHPIHERLDDRMFALWSA